MIAELKFINDIAKPWDNLNALLVQRYAFQPDLSDVTTRVSAIATAIKHQVDILALDRGCRPKKLQAEVDAESEAARLMSDVSDVAKHLVLGDPIRQNGIFVAAMFEVNPKGYFRFLRNGVFIEHVGLGRHDFMSTALSAIEYWTRKRTLNLAWSGGLLEGSDDFFSSAFLKFDPNYCVNMSNTRIMFFCRDDAGNLQSFDPKEVRFEVHLLDQNPI